MRNETALKHAKAMRSEPTAAEARLWHQLRGKRFEGAKFRRQTPIGAFVADFSCRSAMLVIEVDGDTHGATQDYDAWRTQVLAQHGWRVVRFTNDDVMSNMEGVLLVIQQHLCTTPLA